jgi:hypothetical protein
MTGPIPGRASNSASVPVFTLRLFPVGWGSSPATTQGLDHARIAAPDTDSSW